MREDITCVFEGVGSCGAIYISDLKAAENSHLLSRLHIKAMITAVRGKPVRHSRETVTDYLYVPADDIETYDLSQHFEETFQFIDNARRKTNVLVHCYAGISRSATIVIAYLMRKYSYPLQKVISMVRRKRNKVHPNKGFLEQLRKEAAKIGIIPNENQQPIQQLLTKSSVLEKKKSTYWDLRIGREPSLQSADNKETLLSSTALKIAQQPSYLEQSEPRLKHVSGRQNTKQQFQSIPVAVGRPQKIQQKIEQLKSRVLESEKRKCMKHHKRYGSEYKNNWTEAQATDGFLVKRISVILDYQ